MMAATHSDSKSDNQPGSDRHRHAMENIDLADCLDGLTVRAQSRESAVAHYRATSVAEPLVRHAAAVLDCPPLPTGVSSAAAYEAAVGFLVMKRETNQSPDRAPPEGVGQPWISDKAKTEWLSSILKL